MEWSQLLVRNWDWLLHASDSEMQLHVMFLGVNF